MKVLAMPLSAGSKALQILLHLNKRLHHLWCGFFIARIFYGNACRTLGFGLHICLRKWFSLPDELDARQGVEYNDNSIAISSILSSKVKTVS